MYQRISGINIRDEKVSKHCAKEIVTLNVECCRVVV